MVGATIPNIALVWNWQTNAWAFRDLPNAHFAASGVIDATATETFDSKTATFDSYTDPFNFSEYTQASHRLLIASSATKLYLADASKQFSSTDYRAYISREGMDFDSPESIKLIQSIRPIFDGGAGDIVNIYVGGTDDMRDAVTWADPVPFEIGETYQADFLEAWRYIAVKFETTTQATWRLKSYEIEYEIAGRY